MATSDEELSIEETLAGISTGLLTRFLFTATSMLLNCERLWNY